MRISDWSSDVCSSDLSRRAGTRAASRNGGGAAWSIPWPRGIDRLPDSPCAWGARQGATPCPFPQERLQPRALRPLSTIKIPRLEPLLQRISLPRDREVPRLQRLACAAWRSEEHTSELHSLMRNSYAVFC